MKHMILDLPNHIHQALWRHLLPPRLKAEEAAFACVTPQAEDGLTIFSCLEWIPVPPDGFASRSPYHFELSDEMRGKVIKRAHDLGASLVEFHSHGGHWPAQFSLSDRAGFEEFVPHVWWRLKKRPYLAVVVARAGFDGFVWAADPRVPERLTGIRVAGRVLRPTALSALTFDGYGLAE